MKRKHLSLVLLVIFLLGILAGCGGEATPAASATPSPSTSTSAEETTPAENTETVKIVVSGWPSGDTAFNAILPGFNELYPHIEVELSFMQTADHHQQLSTALAAGTSAADVVMLEQAWVGRYKDSGGFENLLDDPYNAAALKQDFVEYKWKLAESVDGEQLIGLVWDIGPATLFYRRDTFEAAGLPSDPAEVEALLSTWEGVLEAAEKIHVPNERWLMANAAEMYTWNFMNRDFYNEDLELVLNKPGTTEALEAAITMRKNGWDAGLNSIWSNEAYAGLASGDIATVVAGCWYGGFLKDWIAPDTSGQWGVCRLPGGISDSNWGGSYLAIPSQGENKTEAWQFITYALATKEAQNTMFETVDYFPGYIPAWGESLYEEEDPFFGGQKVRSLWVDISKSIQPTFATLMDSTTEGALGNSVFTGLNEGKTAEEIIAMAVSQIEIETREDKDRFMDILDDAGLLK